MQRDTEGPNQRSIDVVLTNIPHDDYRLITIPIHGLKEIVQLSLRPTRTQLANDIEHTASHGEYLLKVVTI
jgi:hypothetical protein